MPPPNAFHVVIYVSLLLHFVLNILAQKPPFLHSAKKIRETLLKRQNGSECS